MQVTRYETAGYVELWKESWHGSDETVIENTGYHLPRHSGIPAGHFVRNVSVLPVQQTVTITLLPR